MRLLSLAYRVLSNFLLLALVYYSLNLMEKYPQRAVLAILVLVYAATRATSAFRSFYFFQRIERLEIEARRLAGVAGEGPASSATRKQVVNEDVGRRCAATAEINVLYPTCLSGVAIVPCISKMRQNRSLSASVDACFREPEPRRIKTEACPRTNWGGREKKICAKNAISAMTSS